MSKKNVLHIAPAPPQLGGMEAFMGSLLASSLVQRHNIRLLNISKPRLFRNRNYAIKTGYAGAFKRKLSITATSYAYSISFMAKFIANMIFQHIDIVHIHTASYTSFWEKCLYIQAARLAGKKVVLHVHGALFKEFYNQSLPKLQSLIRHFLNKCDAVIVLSESWKDFFSTLVSGNLVIVRNGIDLKPLERSRGGGSVVTFLHVGEVSERKGVYDLIAAADLLKRAGHTFHISIAGPGEIDKAMAKVKERMLDEEITFFGPVRGKEKYALFRNSDVFILASYGEGLPIAILEALAAGLPIITTPVGGIAEVIVDGENGFLVEPGNVDALAEAMETLIKDSTLRERQSETNYDYARQNFDIENCARQIDEIYQSIS